MPRLRPLLFALAASFALGACATPAADSGEPVAGNPPPAAENPKESAMPCHAEKGQWAIGKASDEALVARIKADTGAERVRVIGHGMMVTMDYREDRLNLELDPDGKIEKVRCG